MFKFVIRTQRVGGAGSSSQGVGSGSVISDPLFISVVRNILNDSQANSTIYHSPPTYTQVLNIANEMQRNPKSGSQAFSSLIVSEVTQLVGEILQSIYKKYENASVEEIWRVEHGADDMKEDGVNDVGENDGEDVDGEDDGGDNNIEEDDE